ncbi:hypothetical protein FACS1894158_14650 [Betaproteobacteria bacterium]|nr:hypothetical protein FACS1894158_14650 [Betaproteobacteria bacterium]GHU19746.1 hypothetical protein FACS189475_07500 [Betaproteobacteria bacterium]
MKHCFIEILFAIVTRWWLMVVVLASIGGFLELMNQLGSQSFSWLYVAVRALWGGGLGLLFVVGNVNKGKGIVPHLLSVSVMVVVAGITGSVLTWEFERTLWVMLGAAVLGLIANKWVPSINLE